MVIATLNKEMYVDIFRRLRDAIRRKHPLRMENHQLVSLHDSVVYHMPLLVENFLAKKNVTTLEHPPYSPDLSTCFLDCKHH